MISSLLDHQARRRVLMGASALVASLCLALTATPASAGGLPDVPVPPRQPEDGPAGRAAPYGCTRAHRYGTGGQAFHIFTPDCPGSSVPSQGALPVVVFLHGFFALDPAIYGAWIDHVVRRGAIVVFPVYQSGIIDLYQTPNAALAVNRALEVLASGALGVSPDLSRIVYAGHSAGGGIAVNLAALSAEGTVPVPFAVHAVEPGANLDPADPGAPDPFGVVADWSAIPESTRLVVVVGDRDDIVGDEPATAIWMRTSHLPPEQRRYMILRSSPRPPVPVLATHLAPLAPRYVSIPNLFDTGPLDWLVWATLDSLVDCSADPAVAGCPVPDRLPGWEWSDGVPFPPADVYDGSLTPPRIPVTRGNASAYVFLPVFERLAPICPMLGSFCGTPPPPT